MGSFHPYITSRQTESQGQRYLSRAYSAVKRNQWLCAKYWFQRAQGTGERCPTPLGEIGVIACEEVLSLGEATVVEQAKKYREVQARESRNLPRGCLI